MGFSVNGGFVSAGRCGEPGTTTTNQQGVSQGIIQARSFPTNDYGWVATNFMWTPQPWVADYNNSNIVVAGSQEASVGASPCRSGYTTGWRCGTLKAVGRAAPLPTPKDRLAQAAAEGRVSNLPALASHELHQHNQSYQFY